MTQTLDGRPHAARVPFRVVGDSIGGLEDRQRYEFMLDGQPATLERRGDWYALTVTAPSRDAAEAACPKLMGALKLMAVRTRLAVNISNGRAHITPKPEDPAAAIANLFGQARAANGLGDGHLPAVYPADEEPLWMFVGDATLSVNRDAANVASHLRFSNALDDKKLSVAVDFFISHLTLGTREARLIALVIALESVRREQPNHPEAVALIDRWILEAKAKARSLETGDGKDAVLQLVQTLGHQKKLSLSKQMQQVVREAYETLSPEAAATAVAAAKDCYGVRSNLAHDGFSAEDEINRALGLLAQIVPGVLIFRACGEVPPPLEHRSKAQEGDAIVCAPDRTESGLWLKG